MHETTERFLREIAASAELAHENIVRVLDCGEEAGTYFIASEFVDRGTVEELVLGDEGDLAARGEAKRGGHAGQTTADYQDVVILQRGGVTMEWSGSALLWGKALQDQELFSYAPVLRPMTRKCAPKE